LSDEFRSKFVKDAFSDWKIWVNCIMTLGNFLPLYSVSIFLPTIIRSMGYSNETAQLLTVPPYVLACIATVGAGFVTDKHRTRGVYVIGIASVA
jgi:MFS family permease